LRSRPATQRCSCSFDSQNGERPPITKINGVSGIVTFVFTDIEGSTQRWDRHGSAMQAALRRHDELMRAAVAVHGGHVFKTIGDAFCIAFDRPEKAVNAILDAQRALAAQDFTAVGGLRVRAAIHSGTADERDGDYFGPTLNRVARLVAIGHGGQVLISGTTVELLAGALPAPLTLRGLGQHRLRDLARPEHVHQLLAPDLVADFPPLRSLNAQTTNLPVQLTSFIGRETEVAQITALFAEHRMLTLIGSGGIGKTRTSLHVAAQLVDFYPDGVWFVELAPLASGDYLPSTVAQLLGVTLSAEGDPTEMLVRALKRHTALLIFDNCEHLIEPAARVISAILRDCPHVRVLASSRQALRIAGEATYRMPSLGVPKVEEGSALRAADVALYAGTSLFVERARASNDRFAVSDDTAPIVADICRRLDGIPLAIELAASRIRILGPRQLRERLDERFRLLTGGSRDVLPRQQTLRALIDWSHDLLDERERSLFRRHSVFVNGSTLEGVVAVAGGADLDELEVFDLLGSLVDKSLVLAEPDGDALRYRMLESTRAYAAEKLADAGESDELARRHLRYLRDRFAALWAQSERSGRPDEVVKTLAAELEDVRFALESARTRSDVIAGSELLAGIGGNWLNLALGAEGAARNASYLSALPAGQSRLRAVLSTNASFLSLHAGQTARAFDTATQALAHARESGEPQTLAEALLIRGTTAGRLGMFDVADAALFEAQAIPETSAYFRLRLFVDRATLSAIRGDSKTAATMLEQARERSRALGNTRLELRSAINLAETEHAQGNTARATGIVRECLPALRSGAYQLELATTLRNLTGYLLAVDDHPAALAVGREAVELYAEMDPDHARIAFAVEHIALVAALRGDLARAATLEGYAEAAIRRHGGEREPTETKTFNRLGALLRDGLDREEFKRQIAAGAALAPEAATALALSLALALAKS
jgi:predicted ATPase/class 3 adenylate cyclase